MEAGRAILHADMDAFFASVEQHDHPELKDRPVVVGAPPNQRGVISAASYEARRYGIHSAMPSRTAAKRCPAAVFLPVNMTRYKEVSLKIIAIFHRFTPLVEQLSIDEAFLDVSGVQKLFGTPSQIARKIKDAVLSETGLTVSVGVASNKFLAKLASDMDKPDGLTVVPASTREILTFLAPLPVGRLWGVGKATQEILHQAGIRRIGDLQSAQSGKLAALLGRHSALHLQNLAHGEDGRSVEIGYEEKSISRECTFLEDCNDRERVRRTLMRLVDEVAMSLRKSGLSAKTVRLKLRWSDYSTITRQKTLTPPADDTDTLREASTALFVREKFPQPVRLIGFGVSRFEKPKEEQLYLFDNTNEKRKRLSQAVDEINSRFGHDSIHRG